MARDILAEYLGGSRCVRCRAPGRMLCASCRARLSQPAVRHDIPEVDRVIAAWGYDGITRSLVLAMKARGRRAAATELGRAIAERVWQEGTIADALVWIPGRPRDIRERGFDHARLIADVVSRELGMPALSALVNRQDRVDQTALGARERKANLEGALISGPVPRRIAVVDDLMTTGATLSEAGRALKQAGACRVEGLIGCLVEHPAMTTSI